MKAIITFITKIKFLGNFENDEKEEYIIYKKDISRKDCNLKPPDHDYYNSDLFPGMLKRAYVKAIGGREWEKLSDLPDTVTVEKGSFLATVKVEIDV